ncbi:HET-domain-containing protein, partial [Lojkania enalia]
MSSIYEALHEGRREIRLLQFDDVPDNGGISLLLENHSLVEPGLSFQALSYTWVTDAEAQAKANSNEKIDVDSKLISVNGIDFAVASNLFAALPHIRHMICNSPDEPKFFWVDAISINQEDDKEKASQVGMMGDIYRAASKVIIWLGEED